MCGILGSFYSNSSVNIDQIKLGLKALDHRGPDDNGLKTFEIAGGQLALGHTRLSIIDLSSGGHQPMHSSDGRYTVVFNGEIYNYRELREELKEQGHNFQTDSDTEVLIAAWAQWGVEGLRRLIGMFSFVMFDQVDETLTLVRDAFGIKPLFFTLQDDMVAFASEITALLALLPKLPELNQQVAFDYLKLGSYDRQEQTFYQGLLHLLPGHYMQIPLTSCNLAKTVRWWWPSIKQRNNISFEQAVEELRERFLQNIRLHLRSDVPLGAALSGGIDSSAVVCAMRYLEPKIPIHTFSYVAKGSSVNEEHWIDIVNSHVGAVPHKVTVNPSEMIEDLDDMIRAQGEPFGSTSIYAQYRVFKAAREAGITVILDGQGADEILAGYWGYPHARMRSLFDSGSYLDLLTFMYHWKKRHQYPFMDVFKAFVYSYKPVGIGQKLRLKQKINNPFWLNSEFNGNTDQKYVEPDWLKSSTPGNRRLSSLLRLSVTGKDGLVHLLRHEDRNAMRWSIESRVPFLTTDLVEFLLSLPENYLLSNRGETKHIFRSAMRGIVPDEILNRQDKIGFATPEYSWLKLLKPYMMEWLHDTEKISFLNMDAVRSEYSDALNDEKSFTWQTWRLLNFCRWYQINFITDK